MKRNSKIFAVLLCLKLCSGIVFAQTTPIDQVAPGPHLLFETRNHKVNNNPNTPSVTFDLYMSASQAYVDYINMNGVQYGMQSCDVAFDLDFGLDGTTVYTQPSDRQIVKTSNQLSDLQAPISLAPGIIPAGYDSRFKFTLYRLPASDLVTTTPTHVATATITWPAGVVIGTPGLPSGSKIQLRCAATGFGTGLSGSKWGDLSGNSANTMGASSGPATPLPIKLVAFNASREGNFTSLSWSTSEEANSDYFEVQRSSDGKAWGKLKSIPAKGESSVEAHYSAIDENPLSGKNYYRLKMVDQDGTFALSRIRDVEFDIKKEYTLFPNPVTDKLNFKSTEDWNNVSSIKIYNARGMEVYSSPLVPAKEVTVKNWPSGTYVVKLSRKNGEQASYQVLISR